MSLPAQVRGLATTMARHGPAAGAHQLAFGLMRRVAEVARVSLLTMSCPPEHPKEPGRAVRYATLEDLVPVLGDPSWGFEDLTTADVELLFGAGHHCAINVVDGELAGYAWMNPSRVVVPRLEAAFRIESDEAHIYKGFTHPRFRGRHLGQDRFAQWLLHPPRPGLRRLVTDFAADNRATMVRVRPLGLALLGSGTVVRRGARRARHLSAALKARLLGDIPVDLAQRDH